MENRTEWQKFYQNGYLYEVYNSKNERVFFTSDVEAIDNSERVSELLKSEHKFKSNGKSIPKTKAVSEIKKLKK